jgi:hypothetical protein
MMCSLFALCFLWVQAPQGVSSVMQSYGKLGTDTLECHVMQPKGQVGHRCYNELHGHWLQEHCLGEG